MIQYLYLCVSDCPKIQHRLSKLAELLWQVKRAKLLHQVHGISL